MVHAGLYRLHTVLEPSAAREALRATDQPEFESIVTMVVLKFVRDFRACLDFYIRMHHSNEMMDRRMRTWTEH